MNVAVFGLGYVGCVSAACLSKAGHSVVGVDPDTTKTTQIGRGISPFKEPGLSELLQTATESGLLRVSTDARSAVRDADVFVICVGTPSDPEGRLDIRSVTHVTAQISQYLTDHRFPVLIFRSTMLPGCVEEEIIPLIENVSGREIGHDIGFCVVPEFLREGFAIADHQRPPFLLIGSLDNDSAIVANNLFSFIDAPVHRSTPSVVSMVKYASNAFHAMKVVFANEIAELFSMMDTDADVVKALDVFAQDDRLNTSRAYLRPGLPFGGSCLPKDVRALTARARELGIYLPLLESIIPSNDRRISVCLQRVRSCGKGKIGVLGVAFKPGADDARESPSLEVIRALLREGRDVIAFDRDLSRANRPSDIRDRITDDLGIVIATSDIIVIGNASPEFAKIADRLCPEQKLIDLSSPG